MTTDLDSKFQMASAEQPLHWSKYVLTNNGISCDVINTRSRNHGAKALQYFKTRPRPRLLHCCRLRDKVQIWNLKKLLNILKSKFWKSAPQFCAHWDIDHECQVLQESEKNCRRSRNLEIYLYCIFLYCVAIWKSLTTHTHRQTGRQSPIL